MRRILIACLLVVATASPSLAEAISLRSLSGYLNGLETAQGTFTQINSDGSVDTGDIYIHRPGRVRFEYDSDDLLVIAGGRQVAVFDGRSNARPEQYPLSETPLNLILARRVDLGGSGTVIRHSFDGTATRVLARDPDRPDIGTIELVFTPDPIELRQWVITDSTGAETTVVLGGLQDRGRPSSRLFNIPLEIQARQGG